MRTGIVLLATGVAALAYLPRAPDPVYCAFLPLLALAAWVHRPVRVPALMGCCFLWALLQAHGRLVKLGKRLCVCEIHLYSQDREDMIAQATATYSIPPR